MADIRVCSHGKTSPCDECELLVMLALRKELDPDAPDIIILPENQIARANRIVKQEYETISTMVEAQRLADRVVDLAVDWHESDTDIEDCLDKAEALGNAIDDLLEFRRKMPIVKNR